MELKNIKGIEELLKTKRILVLYWNINGEWNRGSPKNSKYPYRFKLFIPKKLDYEQRILWLKYYLNNVKHRLINDDSLSASEKNINCNPIISQI